MTQTPQTTLKAAAHLKVEYLSLGCRNALATALSDWDDCFDLGWLPVSASKKRIKIEGKETKEIGREITIHVRDTFDSLYTRIDLILGECNPDFQLSAEQYQKARELYPTRNYTETVTFTAFGETEQILGNIKGTLKACDQRLADRRDSMYQEIDSLIFYFSVPF